MHYQASIKTKHVQQPIIIKSVTCSSLEQFWDYCKRFALVETNTVTVSMVK